jgi:hypothetical protein
MIVLKLRPLFFSTENICGNVCGGFGGNNS